MPSSPELLDVSRPLAATTACWPGDVPYAFTLGWSIAGGASVNVGAISTSVHTATHCDAPYHYDGAGTTVERLSLDVFVGPAYVVDVAGRPWLDAIQGLDFTTTPRVLFRTGGWPDATTFPASIPVMEVGVADWLGERGVRLIGVDLPSVDALDSKTLANHHALGRHGIVIVEGLMLDAVEPGRYELLALPLKIVGGDGAPLRAALRRIPSC